VTTATGQFLIAWTIACSEYTRRSLRQRSPQSNRRSFKQPVCGSSPLCKLYRSKISLISGGLDGHNNVCFIAYGCSQWLDWHEEKENYQVAGASKKYDFQAETHSTGYRPISTNSTN